MTTPTPVDEGTPLDLEAIKARADAATEGPWHRTGWPWSHGDVLADMVFVAAARDDVPALVAEVVRLRSELATAQAEGNAAHEDLTRVTADRDGIITSLNHVRGERDEARAQHRTAVNVLKTAYAERDAALKVVEAVRHLHTDSVMGVCPSCGDIGVAFSGQGDGLVNYPCPTIVAVDALDAWKADQP